MVIETRMLLVVSNTRKLRSFAACADPSIAHLIVVSLLLFKLYERSLSVASFVVDRSFYGADDCCHRPISDAFACLKSTSNFRMRLLKADLHGTTLSHAICLQVYDSNRFV